MQSEIKRSGLAEQVISRIRALVAEGTFPVGGRIPSEAELSVLFGVGRSTIREAVRVLADRGLIEVRHGEGTFVVSKTVRESFEDRLSSAILADIYEARLLLELALSELATVRRDRKDIAAMRRSLDRREHAIRTGNVSRYAEADFGFHLAVAKAAKNPVLLDLYESFVRVVEPLLVAATTPEYIRNEDDRLHGALCDAIASGRVAETRRLVRLHLRKSLEGIGKRLG
jgi:GntR family transcriptional regulator, transcriptional repressor for pyruvate dehydrogenase complex